MTPFSYRCGLAINSPRNAGQPPTPETTSHQRSPARLSKSVGRRGGTPYGPGGLVAVSASGSRYPSATAFQEYETPAHVVGLSRRGMLRGSAVLLQALISAPSSQAAAPQSTALSLPPLSQCIEKLNSCADQLRQISSALAALRDSVEAQGRVAPGAYKDIQRRLHEGELGRFWATARSADRYISVALPGEKGALARDEADLFALLPERAGPLSKLLKPTWDDADDPLCLVYSCVNDPDAPPSINTLYALKLLHVGLGIGADGDKRVTPEGLLSNVGDAQEKLSEYISIARRADSSMPAGALDSGGALKGVSGPGEKANSFGPSPLG